MPFDRGTVTFRVCHLPQAMPADAVELFAKNAAGSLESVKEEPQWGWVSGRHLLERRIDDETAILGGYLHLSLRQAQRRIPASLLRAECRMAELALAAESKVAEVSRKERKRIKSEISAKMLPQMPPQLSGVPFVIDPGDSRLYLGSGSQSQLDTFLSLFRETLGFEPVPLTPEEICLEAADVKPDSLPRLSLAPDRPEDEAGGTLGQDFLTWLWFFQEEQGGVLPKTQLGDFGLMIDGPLVFVADGPGALESSIRKGVPTISAEAKAALLVGKKLRSAKLTLARGRTETWSASVDADAFVIRGLKLPEGEAMDAGSIFQERITYIHIFMTVFLALFKRFVGEMSERRKAGDLQKQMRRWVQERDGR